jgi:hypothetical protein
MKRTIILALMVFGLARSSQAAADLVWTPTDANWNTTTANWTPSGGGSAVAFADRDNVTLDGTGGSYTTITLGGLLSPSNVVVDAWFDYTLLGGASAKLNNVSSLTKKNSGTLILDADNVITNSITIEEGTIQLGAATTRGTLGTGSVTNYGTLAFNRTNTAVNFSNNITGNGKLSILATANAQWSFRGTNTMTDYTIEHGGSNILYFTNSFSVGSPTNIQFIVSQGNQRLQLGGGVTLPANCPMTFPVPSGDQFTRASVMSVAGTNAVNGPIYIGGGSYSNPNFRPNVNLYGNSPTHLQVIVNSSVEDIPGNPFQGNFYLRGNTVVCTNKMYGKITLSAGQLLKDEATTWTLCSTGNVATLTWVGGGRLNMGATNALPVSQLTVGDTAAGILDLAGFDQKVGPLFGSTQGLITNSSTTSDAILTLTNGGAYSGVIKDNGTTKIGLKLLNPGAPLTQQLLGDCSYKGATTLDIATALALGNSGLPNSTPIEMGDGSSIDLTYKSGYSFTLGAAQTLKAGGNVYVANGSFVNQGTLSLRVTNNSGTISADRLNVATNLTYGGTLHLDLQGEALSSTDTIKLFDAASYTGASAFSTITPTTPGPGLAWNTSSLTTDGTLKVDATLPSTPTNITFSVVSGGTELELGWPESYTGWTLQGQTNAINVGLTTSWYDVPGSATTNRILIPISKSNGAVFYRLHR